MKLLKYISGILLIIILAEVIYLFIFHNPSLQDPELTQTGNQIDNSINQTNNEGELNWSDIKNVDQIYTAINPQIAIDPKVIYTHIFYKKGITQSSTIQNIHEGTIESINRAEIPAFYDYYNSVLTIRVVDPEDQSIGITFNFSEQDMDTMEIVEIINGVEEPIEVVDLAVGDSITIEDTINATYSQPINPASTNGYLTKSWGSNRINTKIIKQN